MLDCWAVISLTLVFTLFDLAMQEEDGDAMDTGRRHDAAEHDGSPDAQLPKKELYTV
jgi:hypothetical protein